MPIKMTFEDCREPMLTDMDDWTQEANDVYGFIFWNKLVGWWYEE
jgi:hypothetical protein